MKKINLTILAIFLLLINISFILAETADIEVTLLNQDPDPANQGEIVEIRFKVENLGGETKDNTIIELLPKYPFSLYTGTAERNIGKLRAGQTGADAVIVDYKIKVDEHAIEGDNEIELQVKIGSQIYSYVDNQFTIDIEEYDIPEIKVYLKETNIFQSNSKGIVTLEIANVEEADVKFMQLTLLPSDDYILLSSSNYVYMGDIDSDDTESEDFEIFIKDVKDGEVNIPVLLQYEDIDEGEYEKQFNVIFNVYSSSELSKYVLKERSYTGTIAVIIILVLFGYYYWKKRKK